MNIDSTMHEIPASTKAESLQHDAYWRLSALHDYESITKKNLMAALKADGYDFLAAASKQVMVEQSMRVQCGQLRYESCTREELLKFVKDKKVEDVQPDHRSIQHFAFRLRQADGKRTFRYLHLPAELRERIAKYYLREFGDRTLTCPTQPPLARTCKLLRREVLPLFYQRCQFRLQFSLMYDNANEVRWRIPSDTSAWIKGMEPDHFACIRRLVLEETFVSRSWFQSRFQIKVLLAADGTHKVSAISLQKDGWFFDTKQCEKGMSELMDEVGSREGPNRLLVNDVYRMRTVLEESCTLER
ncbi:hypothetical protein HII31_11872 [Pseudocercospora fuligena]|uniref:Uncharacterized protein n=1 Tax=Pseudocercospora fuligena TaxID=685502 RepID=A0A8H6VD11_9PEZI|nr:hypothetical protein HII31_11872 [Pseudocercospora fuligena]